MVGNCVYMSSPGVINELLESVNLAYMLWILFTCILANDVNCFTKHVQQILKCCLIFKDISNISAIERLCI